MSFGIACKTFLIARHDVLCNYCKQVFSNVVRYGGRERFYSPMIKSQSFGEPMALVCEISKYYSVLPQTLCGIDGLRVPEFSISLTRSGSPTATAD